MGSLILLKNMKQNLSNKKGKLPTSHRYNRLPLLRSHPGGFSGAGCVGLAVANIVNYLLIPRMEILKIIENI
mgnify:CR=1 FL=1